MCLEADGEIKKWRDLMGATHPAKLTAPCARNSAGSIHKNAMHGSDAPETAAFESGIFPRAGAPRLAIKADRWIRKMALDTA